MVEDVYLSRHSRWGDTVFAHWRFVWLEMKFTVHAAGVLDVLRRTYY